MALEAPLDIPPSTFANFDNILNFRDVGATINDLQGSPSGGTLKPGILFRSARPDAATPADRSRLLRYYRIRTIMDLRSKTEHINAAKKHTDTVTVPSSNSANSNPLQIPGISYAEINLNGKGFERALLKQLGWSSFGKLVAYMTLGYRNEAIAILGREVMQPRGLIGLGMDTLEHSGHEIKEAFETLADEGSYPVLVHCTQGKDRTGLVILLVLLLCGVSIGAISQDYVRSEPELEPEMIERLQEIKGIGLDESFAGCPPDFVEKVVQHVNEQYGCIESYLKTIGVNEAAQKRAKDILLA